MGLKEWLFGEEEKQPKALKETKDFELLTRNGTLNVRYYNNAYENAIVRSAVEAKAQHIAKLKVELQGSAKPKLKSRLKHYPNGFMTWPQFLARCSTILDLTNNLFIIPVKNENMETIGFFPVLPEKVKLVEDKKGHYWLKYQFDNRKYGAARFDECAYLVKHQYKSDLFGETNDALKPTMDLIAVQEASIKSAVESSNNYRFLATVGNFTDPEDLAEERQRFTEYNLKGENRDGVLLFPNTYTDVKELTGKYYTVDTEQMEFIKTNVFDYFGINEEIIQGKATSAQLDAFFNLAIEPFAIALSEAMSRAIYTDEERAYGNHVYVNANRLQYMSVSEKVNMAQQLGDRGVLTINEIRELFNYAPIENGDVAVIRGEYYTVNDKLGQEPTQEETPLETAENGSESEGNTDEQN